MLRKINCIVCGATESSMVHAADPWCGDKCHVAVVNNVGHLTQAQLTPTVFYFLTDYALAKPQPDTWETLRSATYAYRSAINAGSVFGGVVTAEDLLQSGEGSADWARRAVLYSSAPWGQQVSELRQPRAEVRDGVLPAP